jgi:hypothetical protein
VVAQSTNFRPIFVQLHSGGGATIVQGGHATMIKLNKINE